MNVNNEESVVLSSQVAEVRPQWDYKVITAALESQMPQVHESVRVYNEAKAAGKLTLTTTLEELLK